MPLESVLWYGTKSIIPYHRAIILRYISRTLIRDVTLTTGTDLTFVLVNGGNEIENHHSEPFHWNRPSFQQECCFPALSPKVSASALH